MVEYITWLKALAALLITNSHLGGIYPLESLATGGLLGNLIFFAVSGFCLYNIKLPFISWYWRRLTRIYPAVWCITALCIAVGTYHVSSWQHALQLFFYPTYYHFIASILILYVPFYFVARHANSCSNPARFILTVVVLLTITYIFCYILAFDYSYYHIDTVEEPMILFAYFVAMLMGANFRIPSCTQQNRIVTVFLLVASVAFYFYTKKSIISGTILSSYQFINQISIICLLYGVLRSGKALNNFLEKSPRFLRKPAALLASVTLEVYLVQYLVIRSSIVTEAGFPISLILVLGGIVLLAWFFHVSIAKMLICLHQEK